MKPELVTGTDAAETAAQAAVWFLARVQETLADAELCRVMLAGGRTPRALHEQIVDRAGAADIEWTRVRFYWGDERPVPPRHPDSNFGMAEDTLLRPLKIDDEHVFRMRGEDKDLKRAARQYDTLLREQLGARPRIDVLVLGMGADGHTASLFPGSPAVHELEKFCAAVYSRELGSWRLTVTSPILNAAHHAAILVTGEEKSPVLRQVWTTAPDPDYYPVHLLWERAEPAILFADRAAASELDSAD